MQSHILTLVLFVVAAVVSTVALPTMIGEHRHQRPDDDAVERLSHNPDTGKMTFTLGKMKFSIKRTQNPQVYDVVSPKSNPRYLAIKYQQIPCQLNHVNPYGSATVLTGAVDSITWFIRYAPPDDLKMFFLTPPYLKLLEKHKHNRNELVEDVKKLIGVAAKLADHAINDKGHYYWSRMGGFALNQFVFNFGKIKVDDVNFNDAKFGDGKQRAEVLMVPMQVNDGPIPKDLPERLYNKFVEDWQAHHGPYYM